MKESGNRPEYKCQVLLEKTGGRGGGVRDKPRAPPEGRRKWMKTKWVKSPVLYIPIRGCPSAVIHLGLTLEPSEHTWKVARAWPPSDSPYSRGHDLRERDSGLSGLPWSLCAALTQSQIYLFSPIRPGCWGCVASVFDGTGGAPSATGSFSFVSQLKCSAYRRAQIYAKGFPVSTTEAMHGLGLIEELTPVDWSNSTFYPFPPQ